LGALPLVSRIPAWGGWPPGICGAVNRLCVVAAVCALPVTVWLGAPDVAINAELTIIIIIAAEVKALAWHLWSFSARSLTAST
jgi:hypothetical protein